MQGMAYIGTSGFTYDHWKGRFYPSSVPRSKWLEHYAGQFETVEINSTYYHMPRENVCASWRQRTPADFCFVLKLNRFITHRKRLAGCRELLESFLSAAGALGDKLGALLVQLPPRLPAEPGRLEAFLKICSPRHRWAVEFRDPSWLCEEVYAVLRSYGVALVIHDQIKDHPHEVTADFVYLRYHGPRGGASSYSAASLDSQAELIRGHLSGGIDVFAYFNNDYNAYAPRNASRLRQRLSL